MKANLASLAAAFAARTPRERAVIVGASVLAVLALGYEFFVEPALLQRRLLAQRIEQQHAELQALAPEMQALRQRNLDPDASRKVQIEVLRTRLAKVDEEFNTLQRSLVPPREMGQLIDGLLKQHGGLQLVALRSLPVMPLSQRETAADALLAAAHPASAASAPNDPADAWLYLHGVQITVQGSYADMHAYLQALERLPRRLFWGTLKIDAQAWPASVMTVTVYTVSLERTWWSV